jgi:uncharacterized protein (DUF4415 family)
MLRPLSDERIAEIKAFKNMDFSDIPIQTAEDIAQFHPKYPEKVENKGKRIEISLAPDVSEWLAKTNANYSDLINQILRDVIRLGRLTASL